MIPSWSSFHQVVPPDSRVQTRRFFLELKSQINQDKLEVVVTEDFQHTGGYDDSVVSGVSYNQRRMFRTIDSYSLKLILEEFFHNNPSEENDEEQNDELRRDDDDDDEKQNDELKRDDGDDDEEENDEFRKDDGDDEEEELKMI